MNEGSQSGDDRKEVLQSQVDHFGNFVIVVAVFAKRLTSGEVESAITARPDAWRRACDG